MGINANLSRRAGPAFAARPANWRSNREAYAWSAFWDEQEANSRCLANADVGVLKVLDGHWVRFADSLAPSSQVLDIGCGAGIVGRVLLEARSDLRVTGVDVATIPPSSDWRLRLRPETAMEDLPFENGRFDAAVSQFGFEYGSVTCAAKEAARVLAPGAPFSFVIHHAHSPVVRRDRLRGTALSAILGSRIERAFLSGNPGKLDRELSRIRQSVPPDVIVDQVANALRSRLVGSCNDRRAIWNAIVEALEPERELIAALETSCVAPERLDGWLEMLSGPLEILNASILREPRGHIIGWTIEGVRSRIAKA
jgi:SAM-dependent methyltransferase